jgi:hypothetical protein
MRLGLITDIHNHAAELTRALELFRERGVDQIVTIGDTLDAFAGGDGAAEVAALLQACGAVGVWGNHDFTFCRDVPDRVRQRHPAMVFDVMAKMQPRLVIGDCHFSHKEASVDPHDVSQLWDLSEPRLDLIQRSQLAFAAVASRWQFVGHYHRWWAATPEGPVNWSGEELLRFESGRRYFVVVAAVCDGWCTVLDTDQERLEPMSLAA